MASPIALYQKIGLSNYDSAHCGTTLQLVDIKFLGLYTHI